jgi:hypothetical protein
MTALIKLAHYPTPIPLAANACFTLSHHFSADELWLPEEEAAQLRLEFETELARLEAT